MSDRPFEVTFLARGGQGAWTASVLIAQAAVNAGRYAQSFPEFGPERSGAPVRAYARIWDRAIDIHAGITKADVVAIIDSTLTDKAKPLVRENGLVIINTAMSPREIREKYGFPESVKIFTVDGTKIALETLGRPIANTAILGSLVRILQDLGVKYVSLDDLLEATKIVLGERYSEKIVEANINAIKRAYGEVKKE